MLHSKLFTHIAHPTEECVGPFTQLPAPCSQRTRAFQLPARATGALWPRERLPRVQKCQCQPLAPGPMSVSSPPAAEPSGPSGEGRGVLGGRGCREDEGTASVSFEMGSENQGTLICSGARVWRFPRFRPAPSAAPQTRGRCGPRGRGRTTRLPRTQLSPPQTAQHEGQALSREVSVGCDHACRTVRARSASCQHTGGRPARWRACPAPLGC